MLSGDNPSSDGIRILNCIGGYLYACSTGKGSEFCKEHFVREKIVMEMCKLRLQLISIVKKACSDQKGVNRLDVSFLDPPGVNVLVLLRQIMFTGFPDHVARLDEDVSTRVPAFGSKKNSDPVYQSMWSKPNEVLVIHAESSMKRVRPPPKWIIFEESVGRSQVMTADNSDVMGRGATMNLLGQQIGHSDSSDQYQKLSLKGVTAISANWMVKLGSRPFLRMGRVLPQPEPRYVVERDLTVGFATPHYGPKLWDLDICEIDLKDGTPISCAAFAFSLLQGKSLTADVLKLLSVSTICSLTWKIAASCIQPANSCSVGNVSAVQLVTTGATASR